MNAEALFLLNKSGKIIFLFIRATCRFNSWLNEVAFAFLLVKGRGLRYWPKFQDLSPNDYLQFRRCQALLVQTEDRSVC